MSDSSLGVGVGVEGWSCVRVLVICKGFMKDAGKAASGKAAGPGSVSPWSDKTA